MTTAPLAASVGALRGAHVALEPLAREHADALLGAALEDRSTYGFTAVPDSPAAMRQYIDGLLADAARGAVVPFAQRSIATGALVGCTRYLDIHHWRSAPRPDAVEIGGTWLAASAQRTPINTEAKLLLLTNAFETWGVERVAICTDADNARSRAAIERIGATFEGILRNYRVAAGATATAARPATDDADTNAATTPDHAGTMSTGARQPAPGAGRLRDTALYAVTAFDWPTVKAQLVQRLTTPS